MSKKAKDTQIGGDHYSKMKIQPIEFIQANGLDFCQGKLAKFKIPKSVRFTESFTPYISGAGKILKRRLREDFG